MPSTYHADLSFPFGSSAVTHLGVNSITTSVVFQNCLVGSRRKHPLTARAGTSCQPCSRYPTASGTRCFVQTPSQTDTNSAKRPPHRPRLGRIPRKQPRRRRRRRRLPREFRANLCPLSHRYLRHRRISLRRPPLPHTRDRIKSSRATSSQSGNRSRPPSRSRSEHGLFPLRHKHHPRPTPKSHNKHTRRPPRIHRSYPPNLPHNLKHFRPPPPPRSLLPRRSRLPNDALPLPLRKHLSNHDPPHRRPPLPRPLPSLAELHLPRPNTSRPSLPETNHALLCNHARRQRRRGTTKTPHARRQEDAHQAAQEARGLARSEGGEGGGRAGQGGARAGEEGEGQSRKAAQEAGEGAGCEGGGWGRDG